LLEVTAVIGMFKLLKVWFITALFLFWMFGIWVGIADGFVYGFVYGKVEDGF